MTPPDTISVYVHFPWCLVKCPYCDFHSIAARQPGETRVLDALEARSILPHEAYADAVLTEFRRRRAELPRELRLESVFFGGGTPSLWEPRAIARVLQEVREAFDVAPDLEVTAESNPTSLDDAQIDGMLEAGISRVSIGVQNLDGASLAFLGRLHDPEGGVQAVERALARGVPRVSADLIYGLHRQGPEQAAEDVGIVASLGVGHISAYALTVEENTRFGALKRAGRLPLLDDELVAASFEAVSSALETRGFEHYEISNFARPGERSRHNLRYWLGHDYLGVGSGAFGTVRPKDSTTRLRYRNLLSLDRYLEAFSKNGETLDPFVDALAERETIDGETTAREAILLGLRIADGLDVDELERRTGVSFWTESRQRSANRLVARGQLAVEGRRVRIPRTHWLHADGIIVDLL